MKKVLFFLLPLISISCSEPKREIAGSFEPASVKFKYEYKKQILEIQKKSSSYEIAFHEAAQECFNFYTKPYKGKTPEEIGLDIIDVCANPRK